MSKIPPSDRSSASNQAPPTHLTALVLAVLISVLPTVIPVLRVPMLPLLYLNTHIHEFMHAFVAALTGGSPERIEVFANGSGVTPIRGGMWFFFGPAGYVGSTVAGALMIGLGRTPARAAWVLRITGISLFVSMLIWVRGDLVGLGAGAFWVFALLAAGFRLKGPALVYLCQFLGVQQCLASLNAVVDLITITSASEAHSDARIMQQYTAIPAMAWAVSWCVLSLVLMFFTIRSAWRARH